MLEQPLKEVFDARPPEVPVFFAFEIMLTTFTSFVISSAEKGTIDVNKDE